MTLSRKSAVLVTLIVAAGCSGSAVKRQPSPSDIDTNFELTVEVSTPKGMRAASSLIYVMREVAPPAWCSWMCPPVDKTGFRGEAPMVDLPNGRKLFVLFTRIPSETGPENWLGYSYAVKSELEHGQSPNKNPEKDLDGDGLADLPSYSPMPYLVTFRDLRDPATIKAVDPRDLAATFGPGYRLRRIALKPIDGQPFPQPTRILAALPWLNGFRTEPVDNPDGSTTFPNDIARYSFILDDTASAR